VTLEERLALAPDLGDGEQEMLGGNVLVTQALRLGLRKLDDATGARIHRQRAALDPGPPCEDGREFATECGQVDTKPAERLGGDAVVRLDERRQDVLDVEDRAVESLGGRLRGEDGLLGLLGEAFELHGGSRLSDQRGSGCLARSKKVLAAAVASSGRAVGRTTRALAYRSP
jgi:hypothetical protein